MLCCDKALRIDTKAHSTSTFLYSKADKSPYTMVICVMLIEISHKQIVTALGRKRFWVTFFCYWKHNIYDCLNHYQRICWQLTSRLLETGVKVHVLRNSSATWLYSWILPAHRTFSAFQQFLPQKATHSTSHKGGNWDLITMITSILIASSGAWGHSVIM